MSSFFMRTASLGLALVVLCSLVVSCSQTPPVLPGLYSGILPDANGKMRLWNIQLISDGTWYSMVSFEFAQPDDPPVYAPSAQARADAGRWTFDADTLVLKASGSKDMRFRLEGSHLVSLEAEAARPDLPQDAKRLVRH